jgi:hypothetical protein
MNSKLHINLTQGILEVEGDADFVRAIYDDFKDKLSTIVKAQESQEQPDLVKKTEKLIPSKASNSNKDTVKDVPVAKKKAALSKMPTFNKNLNLFKEGNKPNLKDFMVGYNASSNLSQNLLFVYYLKEIKGLKTVGVDDIYTCYKNMGLKIPSVKQSLLNTAFQKGWLDTQSLGDLKITIAGENAVSHELLKKPAEAA